MRTVAAHYCSVATARTLEKSTWKEREKIMQVAKFARTTSAVAVAITALVVSAGIVFSAPAQRSTVPVNPFGDPNTDVPGSSSTLTRTDSGVAMTVRTSGLPSGAYTAWFVIFNNPDLCIGPCDEDDVFIDGDPIMGFNDTQIAAVEIDFARAAGGIVSQNGRGSFAGSLQVGDTTEAVLGTGLLQPRDAEIHLIVRHHGDVIPQLVNEQMHTLNGGCPPNDCEDVQMAIHQP